MAQDSLAPWWGQAAEADVPRSSPTPAEQPSLLQLPMDRTRATRLASLVVFLRSQVQKRLQGLVSHRHPVATGPERDAHW